MCLWAYVPSISSRPGSGKNLHTVRELAEFLGMSPDAVPTADGKPMAEAPNFDWRDCCLCHHDIAAAAKMAGWKAEPERDGDPWCYWLTKTDS